MSTAKTSDRFRIRGRVSMMEGRWYSIVTVVGIDGTKHPGSTFKGPEGGFATEQEALTYYYEKVSPALDEVADRARMVGGSCERVEPTLH